GTARAGLASLHLPSRQGKTACSTWTASPERTCGALETREGRAACRHWSSTPADRILRGPPAARLGRLAHHGHRPHVVPCRTLGPLRLKPAATSARTMDATSGPSTRTEPDHPGRSRGPNRNAGFRRRIEAAVGLSCVLYLVGL